MVKQATSIKMESNQIKTLKTKAAQKNIPVTDMIISSLSAMQDSDHLRDKISVLRIKLMSWPNNTRKQQGIRLEWTKE